MVNVMPLSIDTKWSSGGMKKGGNDIVEGGESSDATDVIEFQRNDAIDIDHPRSKDSSPREEEDDDDFYGASPIVVRMLDLLTIKRTYFFVPLRAGVDFVLRSIIATMSQQSQKIPKAHYQRSLKQ